MTGSEKERLVKTIASAYSEPELRMLTEFKLGTPLDAVVGPGPLLTRVFQLVEYTEREGRTPELVAAVVEDKPHRADIQKAYRGYTTAVASAAGAAGPVPDAAVRDYAKVFGDRPAVSVQTGGGAEAVVTPADAGLQQTIRDDLGFLSAANWSDLSRRMQRRVCRVELNDQKAGMGTGFLVGPDALLTAYHVLEPVVNDPGRAAAVTFRFDYQWHPDGSTTDGVLAGLVGAGGRGPDPTRPWLLSRAPYAPAEKTRTPDNPPPKPGELDYALVQLDRPIGNEGVGGEARGWIDVPTTQPAVNGLQFLLILQHPARRPLELALDTNAKARLLFGGLRLRYATNTERGSSGSPVFDKYWKLVGLHHLGDPGYGHPPEYNQAVPIGLIREDLTTAGLAALGPAGSPAAAPAGG